jgi:hypothetical protein
MAVYAAIGATAVFLATLGLPRATNRIYLTTAAFVIVLVSVPFLKTLDRKRETDLLADLEARGFVPNTAEGKPPVALHFRPRKSDHDLKVELSALGMLGDRPAHVSSYSFEVGKGKNSDSVEALEVALDFPSQVLALALIPRTKLEDRPLSKLFATPPPVLGYSNLAKRWVLETSDTKFAASLITPELAAWLSQSPFKEKRWQLSDGWLSCTWFGKVYKEDLDALFERVETFIRLAGKVEVAQDEVRRSTHAAARRV